MASIKFSSSLYNQLGLKSWQRRQSFFDKQSPGSATDLKGHTELSQNSDLVKEPPQITEELAPQTLEAANETSHHEINSSELELDQGSSLVGNQATHSQKETAKHLDENVNKQTKQKFEPESQNTSLKQPSENQALFSENPPVISENEMPTKKVATGNAVVLIGHGLDSIWENDEDAAWRLWQNIVQAFAWKDEDVVFFDLDCLVSEEAVFSTMEEIIDLAVEFVLAMDAEHALTEQLAEGVQVIEVPDLESMLSDPYAKQTFYETVMSQF